MVISFMNGKMLYPAQWLPSSKMVYSGTVTFIGKICRDSVTLGDCFLKDAIKIQIGV